MFMLSQLSEHRLRCLVLSCFACSCSRRFLGFIVPGVVSPPFVRVSCSIRLPSTYREWRKSYHFEVYWPRDSTGGTTADSLTQPVSYASFYTWHAVCTVSSLLRAISRFHSPWSCHRHWFAYHVQFDDKQEVACPTLLRVRHDCSSWRFRF